MAFNAGEIEAKITADRTPFTREIREAIREGERFERRTFKAKLGFDVDRTRFAEAERLAKQWERRDYKADLDVDTSDVQKGYRSSVALGETWASRDFNADFGVDTHNSGAELSAIRRELERLNSTSEDSNQRLGLLSDRFKDTGRSAGESAVHITAVGSALAKIALPGAIAASIPLLSSLGSQAVVAAGGLAALAPAALGAVAVTAGTAMMAFNGFADALKSGDTPAAAKKQAEALAKLAPAAQEAVKAIQGLGKAYGDMKKQVQENFFKGLGADIDQIGRSYLPTLRDGFTANATALNGLVRGLMGVAKESESINAIERIFANVTNATNSSVAGWTAGARALRTLTDVGSSYLPQLAVGFSNAMVSFQQFIDTAKNTGDLDRFIQSAIRNISLLGSIVGNVGGVLVGMFKAAGTAGLDALGAIDRLTERMSEFFNSAQGQTELVTVFRAIQDTLNELEPVVTTLGAALWDAFVKLMPYLPQVGAGIAAVTKAITPLIGVAGNLGTYILPAVATGLKLVAGILGPIVGAFAALPGPIQAVIAALIGLRMANTWLQGLRTATQGTGVAASAAAAQHSRFAQAVVGVKNAVSGVPAMFTSMGTGLRNLGTAYQEGAAKGQDFAQKMLTAGNNARASSAGIDEGGRAAGRLGTAFTAASGVVTGAANVMKGAAVGIGSGIMRGLSGLVGFLGGPWGVAFAAAGAILTIFAGKQQAAAQAAADYRASLDGLKGTLDSVTGAITAQTNALTAEKLAKDGSIEKARALGISSQDLVAAYNGQGDAIRRVQGSLTAYMDKMVAAHPEWQSTIVDFNQMGVSMDTLKDAATGSAPATEMMNAAIRKMAETNPEAARGMELVRDSMYEAAGPARDLGVAMGLTNQQINQAQKELADAKIAGDAFGQSLRDGQTNLNSYGNAAVQANGQLDMTKLGSDRLSQSLQTTSQEAGNTAVAMGRAAQASQGVGAGAAAAAQSMSQSRNAFLASAAAAGITGDRAQQLANQMGLIPALVTTHFNNDARQASDAMEVLRGKIVSVPNDKQIRINDNSPETIGKLQQLGFKVEAIPNSKDIMVTTDVGAAISQTQQLVDMIKALPNGNIKIDADTKPASADATGMVNRVNALIGTMKIDGDPGPGDGSLNALKARVDAAVAKMQMQGNPDPALLELQRIVNDVTGTKPPPIPLNATPNPGIPAALGQAQQQALGTTLAPPVTPNPAGVPPALATAQANAQAAPMQPPIMPQPTGVPPALGAYQTSAAGTTGTAQLTAEASQADQRVFAWVAGANGTSAQAHLVAESAQADARVFAWAAGANGTFAMAHLMAESGQADARVFGWQAGANGTTAVAHLSAESGQADARVYAWVGGVSGTTATAHLNAESAGADARVMAWQAGANATRAESHLDAESINADNRVRAWQAGANGTRATAHLDAETSGADSALAGFRARASRPIVVPIVAGPRPGGAGGGVVGSQNVGTVSPKNYYSRGTGFVLSGYEPGKDTVPAVLSKGEAVLVPELVKKIGPSNIIRANREASGGRPGNNFATSSGIPGFSGGGIVDAQRELLNAFQTKKRVFEDFSYTGMSANMEKYAHQIADKYYGKNNANRRSWPPKGSELLDWLKNEIAKDTPPATAPGGTAAAAGTEDRGPHSEWAQREGMKKIGAATSSTQVATLEQLTAVLDGLRQNLGYNKQIVGSMNIQASAGMNTADLAEKIIFRMRHATRGVYRR